MGKHCSWLFLIRSPEASQDCWKSSRLSPCISTFERKQNPRWRYFSDTKLRRSSKFRIHRTCSKNPCLLEQLGVRSPAKFIFWHPQSIVPPIFQMNWYSTISNAFRRTDRGKKVILISVRFVRCDASLLKTLLRFDYRSAVPSPFHRRTRTYSVVHYTKGITNNVVRAHVRERLPSSRQLVVRVFALFIAHRRLSHC